MNKSKAITYLHATKWDEFQLIVANRIMPHASNMPHVEVHVFSISLITSAVPFILDAITSSYYSKESMMLNIILFVPKWLKILSEAIASDKHRFSSGRLCLKDCAWSVNSGLCPVKKSRLIENVPDTYFGNWNGKHPTPF